MPRKGRRQRNNEFKKVSVVDAPEVLIPDEEDFIASLKARFPGLDSWVIRLVYDETTPDQVATIIQLSDISAAAAEQKAKLQNRHKPLTLLHRASAPITPLPSGIGSPRFTGHVPMPSESPRSYPRPHTTTALDLRRTPRDKNPRRRYYTPPLKPVAANHLALSGSHSAELAPRIPQEDWPPPLELPGATEPAWSYLSRTCRAADQKIKTMPKCHKLCKYYLCGRCKKGDNCEYSHDVDECQYVSLRNMNNFEIFSRHLERALDVVQNNKSIWFFNVGRNRVGSKMAAMIARVAALAHIRRISMDSSAIGRAGMLSVLDAACESSALEYLDLSDTECCRTVHSTMSADEKRFAQMKREEIVTAIINLLGSPVPLKHLYLGHNGFTFAEIKKMVLSNSKAYLLTLDVHGNNITPEQLEWVHNTVYNRRYAKIYNQLLQRFKHQHEDIIAVICEFCCSDNEARYRCIDWKPKRRRSVSRDRKNGAYTSAYIDEESNVTSGEADILDAEEILWSRYGRKNGKHGRRGGGFGRKNGKWSLGSQ